jgi:hypothetical protein
MYLGGISCSILVAVSALLAFAIIKHLPANCIVTPQSRYACAHRPFNIGTSIQSAAVRAPAKGATWKAVRDELFFKVRG